MPLSGNAESSTSDADSPKEACSACRRRRCNKHGVGMPYSGCHSMETSPLCTPPSSTPSSIVSAETVRAPQQPAACTDCAALLCDERLPDSADSTASEGSKSLQCLAGCQSGRERKRYRVRPAAPTASGTESGSDESSDELARRGTTKVEMAADDDEDGVAGPIAADDLETIEREYLSDAISAEERQLFLHIPTDR